MTSLEENLNKILEEKETKLLPENIKKGINILGIEGENTNSNIQSENPASNNDIILGKEAYVNDTKLVGTMPDNGQLDFKPSGGEQIIPKGYTFGGTIEAVDINTLYDYKICDRIADAILEGTPYIKYNNANSYTDLGIKWNSDYKYEIRFDDSIGLKGEDVTLFGNGGNMFEINDPYRVLDGSYWVNTFQAYKPGQHTLVFSNESGVVMDYMSIHTCTIQTQNTTNIWLGKANWTFNTNKSFQGKIYEFIVYDENNEIVFDAIPDSSGTFKDKITNKLLSTSGEVSYGYDKWTGYVEPIYSELEYIQYNGDAYIDTGISNVNYCKIETKCKALVLDNIQTIFGFHANTVHLTYNRTTGAWYYGSIDGSNVNNFATCNSTISDICEIIYNNENNKVQINNEEIGRKPDVEDNYGGRTLYIFRRHSDNYIFKGIIYYFKIINKQTNKVIIDLIPVKDNYGRVGMYDKISKQLFTSMNNSNFIAGPEIGPLEEV